MLRRSISLAIMLVLAVSCATVATPVVQTAMWGGEHVQMDITRTGANLEFDCATGVINGVVPEAGTFRLKGTFTRERPGPTREGDSRGVDAAYAGTITGDHMSLRIVLAGQAQNEDAAMQYALVRGRPGNVRKCR